MTTETKLEIAFVVGYGTFVLSVFVIPMVRYLTEIGAM